MITATHLHSVLLAAGLDPTGGFALFCYALIAAVVLSLAFFKKYYIVVGPD